MDDLFTGHVDVDPSVVSHFLDWLACPYDTADKKLNVTRGSKHDYLGMNMDFSDKGSVKFDMNLYNLKITEVFPERITGVSSTPAADHLFSICPAAEACLLPDEQARAFHHTTAQLLYFHHTTAQLLFLPQVCCDIQMTVAFLTTWVKQPGEDDCGKLKQVLKYLNSTHNLKLTLFAESLSLIHWYIHASHQTHNNCRGYTGALLTFGRGATTSSSNKQKISTKSSTESEIVGLHDKMSHILWTRNFLEAQAYTISAKYINQDNMSTLSWVKNGYVSSSKCTKHIKVKYFFAKHYHLLGDIHL